MSSEEADDKREQINFISVDSAPKRFAGMVPQWRAFACMGVFTALASAQLFAVNSALLFQYFPNHDWVFSPYEGNHAVAIRIFILSFFVAFAVFSSAGYRARAMFAIDMVVTYMSVCAALDLTNFFVFWLTESGLTLHTSAIVSGLVGFAVYSWKLLERGKMPARIPVEHRPKSNRRAIRRLIVTIVIAAVIAGYVGSLDLSIVSRMREWTLLGGIGPGVFLFLPALFTQLYSLAIYDVLTAPRPRFTPAVSIIIPAHNESYIIEDTINAMDRAAVHYGGEVHILIMNNNSTDDTAEIAARNLANCRAAQGKVIDVPKPGKSNALNVGLDAAETEFLVRVDADTLVGEDNLSRAMPHFTNPMCRRGWRCADPAGWRVV